MMPALHMLELKFTSSNTLSSLFKNNDKCNLYNNNKKIT